MGGPGVAGGISEAAQRGGQEEYLAKAAVQRAGDPATDGRTGGGQPNIEQMMERMPAFTLAEVQPGEPLIVSTTARAGHGGGRTRLLCCPAWSRYFAPRRPVRASISGRGAWISICRRNENRTEVRSQQTIANSVNRKICFSSACGWSCLFWS